MSPIISAVLRAATVISAKGVTRGGHVEGRHE
jgi:hypothetical protein